MYGLKITMREICSHLTNSNLILNSSLRMLFPFPFHGKTNQVRRTYAKELLCFLLLRFTFNDQQRNRKQNCTESSNGFRKIQMLSIDRLSAAWTPDPPTSFQLLVNQFLVPLLSSLIVGSGVTKAFLTSTRTSCEIAKRQK